MALKSVGRYAWAADGIDISNLSGHTYVSSAFKSDNSCLYTAKIIAAGSKSEYPAAWAAYEYSTEGTSAGDWCLPAPGIFTSIYANQTTINAGFSRAGGSKFTTSTSAWTSSINYGDYVWEASLDNDYGLRNTSLYYNQEVHPVIGFCKSGYKYDKNTDNCIRV